MDVRTSSKILAATVLVILINFSGYVFADQGSGYGRQGKGIRYEEDGCGGPGSGWNRHRMGSRGFDRGFRGNLSDEALKEVTKERDAFFEATGELRRQIRQKKLELRAELAKDTPDAGKAVQIQKDVSKLKADFDGQRIEHRLRMKKIHPDLGQGFGSKGTKGSGKFDRGSCWN